MNRLLSTPGYANITATLALLVALGGTGYAAVTLPKHSVGSKQLKKNAVVSKKVKDDSLTGSDVAESTLGTVPNAARLGNLSLRGISQWALVSNAGAVLQSSGGVTATVVMSATGRYRVSFPSDVSACGINANATTPTPVPESTFIPDSRLAVARSTTSVNDVQVVARDPDGLANPVAFYVTVQC